MMRLSDALASLDSFGSDATIYAVKPWTAESPVAVVREGEPEARAAS